ncbi:autotransporter domain-containing protein [Bradyrhizobium sp. AUGA SZCCT0182]|uniref:autotransporter domain-containing protein n=1 Tax=Bradyrhizobium sp. AUGA SZCCT0182 TaxID=2807667 RepID=UPI0028A18BD2|nr:autotransporter domain-containing protein [Bradyrhizobium sp. AUGA SZCCT0182]
MLFRSASGVEKRLRQRAAGLLFGCGLAVAAVPAAHAQSIWGGTTTTSDYNLGTNWTPATAPVAAGQPAVFEATGSDAIIVTGAIAPDSWTFNANSQSFSISGGDVNFSSAGPGGGIMNNANAGQFIGISNNIGESVAGVGVWQLGASTLILSGVNTYTGGTMIFGGTVQVTNANSVGTGPVFMNGGTFQSNGAGNLTFTNDFSVASGGGTIDVNSTVLTLSGVINDIGAGAVLNITDSSFSFGTAVLSGNNTFAGALNVIGARVQATNANSIGNATVTLDNGAFQAGAAALTFFNDVKINTGGGIIDANGNTLFMAGTISNGNGAGALQIVDTTGGSSGVVSLAGTNTYTGGTTVIGTTLQVTNSSSVGTGTVTLDGGQFQADGFGDITFTNNFRINNSAGGGAIDANNVTLTIAGNISDGVGAGQLTVLDSAGLGNGTVVLLGTNTYTGGTTICDCATLQLGDATHTASIVGTVFNEGRLFIVNANMAGVTSITNDASFGFGVTTFMGSNTAGTVAITNQAFGSTVFLETSSAGSATIINTTAGTTVFGQAGGIETSTAGNATIQNNLGGETTFFASTSAGNASIVNELGGRTSFGLAVGTDTSTAGSATITNNNFGFTEFNAFSTAGNATITTNNGGVTNFWDNSTAGNAKIVTNDGGITRFLDNANGGTAQFITNGTGEVNFGGSIGPGSDGRITVGSLAGSGTYYIGGGNTLLVGGNNLSTEVTGVIADDCGCFPGPGSLEKVGTGNLILSGISAYTGSTTVNGGILTVNGSIASSSGVTVNAGGTLGGNGIVSSTTINGGTLAPGNSVGLLTVQGSLAFTAAASYLVEVSGATADRTNVTGAATLGGATVNASFGPGNVVKQYTILNAAGGVGGTFNPVVGINAPNFKPTLSYDLNNVYLNLALSFGPGLTPNQQNVGNALTNAFNAGSGVPVAVGSLTSAGLTQISGELATGSQQSTFDAMNIFLGLLTDPFIAGRSGGASVGGSGATPFTEESGSYAYAAKRQGTARDAFAKFPTKADVARNDLFDQRWSVWGSAFGGGSNSDGNANLGSNNAAVRAFGLAAGADYRISPSTLVGFALAGGGTNFNVNGSGYGRSDLFQAGAFVRHNVGAAYVTAAAVYGWQDVTTDRTVTVAGVDRLRAEFNANAWSGRVEGGYRYVTPWMGITPYAAGQFTTYQLPAYAEQVLSGSNAFALNYAAKDVTTGRSELGVRLDRSFAMQSAVLTLRGRAAWAHNFNTDRSITALFQSVPGATFLVSGAAQAPNTALTTASAEMKWLNGWSAAATFEGEFSDITRSYAGKGVIRYTW